MPCILEFLNKKIHQTAVELINYGTENSAPQLTNIYLF